MGRLGEAYARAVRVGRTVCVQRVGFDREFL